MLESLGVVWESGEKEALVWELEVNDGGTGNGEVGRNVIKWRYRKG